jgi:predicted nucleic acid-binding protein
LADSFLVDASVIAKWFNKGETNEAEALSLRKAWIERKIEILSPSLIIYEVCNSVWKNPNVDRDQAESLSKLVVRLSPTLIEITEEDSEEAMALARRSKLSFYDTTYIVLSKSHKCTLISADNDQLNVAKGYTSSIHISKIKSIIRTYSK